MSENDSSTAGRAAPETGSGASDFSVYDSRPWLEHYPEHARTELGELPYDSFGDLIRASAATYADQPAFTTCLPTGTTGTLTFAEIDELTEAFAAYLRHELGLAKGDRVAIQSPNCLAYPVVVFGIAKAGCAMVNVNPLYTEPEIEHTLNDSGARVLVMIDMFADKLPTVVPQSPVETVLVTGVADFFPWLRKKIVKTVQRARKMIGRIDWPHTPLEKAVKRGRARVRKGQSVPRDEVGPDDMLALQYTGGTTGVSKGAILSHRNILANIEQSRNGMDLSSDRERTALTALPMYHIFALGMAGIVFSLGGHNVLIPSPRPVSNLKPAFEKFDITWFAGVNTLFNGLLNESWFVESPPRNLEISIGGGTAVQDAVAERWKEVVGYEIYQAYGLTETSPGVTGNPIEGMNKQGTIGIPSASTWVRLVDDDGNPAPLGEPGEIIVKGPQVMHGYWNRPDETAKAMQDGWFYTGDIAVMDEDGYFRIVDRKKDMILVSGFNVYPNEIEEVLATHRDVIEAGVVGIADDQTGEAPVAYVVPRTEELTEESVLEHCRKSLTRYKLPKRVLFTDELPKSNVGKVLRKDLRDKVKQDLDIA